MATPVAPGKVSLLDIEQRMKNLELKMSRSTAKPSNLLSFDKNTVNGKSSQVFPNDASSSTKSRKSLTLPGRARPSNGLQFNQMGKNEKLMTNSFISFPPAVKSVESEKVSKRLQEVIKQNGKLHINGNVFSAEVKDFQNLGKIGSGTCGEVYKMLYIPQNHIMAVKQMHRSGNREENQRILMDLDVVQKSHDCPHIVTCYGTLITESNVWICMELMETCFDKLKKQVKGPLPENIIGKLSVAVVKALHYLKEQHGVIHRDVKPSNILINRKGIVKLCDFGISGRLVDSQAKTRAAGCTAYMAPERIQPDPQRPNYDIRADVWSLGITLVELATGNFPYSDCANDFEMLTRILEDDAPSISNSPNFSVDFQRFVSVCCTKAYQKRPKYRDLLEHEFIKRYERIPVDFVDWLNRVLPPPKSYSLPRNVLPPTQTTDTADKDPFAFAAQFTKAQFAKHSRNRSWGGSGFEFGKMAARPGSAASSSKQSSKETPR